ncbi:MAG: DUF4236 domain-containing protein [Pseudomonadota bacterium]|nr:DUF4236 domain-containing protein [Pseudomonadota bacterium]
MKILPGVRLNFSRGGLSTSIGGKGARLTLGKRGARGSVGIPGTGFSYSAPLTRGERSEASQGSAGCLLIAIVAAGLVSLGMCSTDEASTPPPAVTASTAKSLFVMASALNCRASPDEWAAIIRKLPRRETVSVAEERSDWSRIEGVDRECWVASKYLTATLPLEQSTTSASRPQNLAALPRSQSAVQARQKRERRALGGCPCSGSSVCIGPRGGRYCITSGGNKRYGV